MPDPLGPVVITAREIYDQLVRLTTAVEGLLKDHGALVQRLTEYDKDLEKLDKRVQAIESRQWPIPTVAVLVSLIGVGIALAAFLTR